MISSVKYYILSGNHETRKYFELKSNKKSRWNYFGWKSLKVFSGSFHPKYLSYFPLKFFLVFCNYIPMISTEHILPGFSLKIIPCDFTQNISLWFYSKYFLVIFTQNIFLWFLLKIFSPGPNQNIFKWFALKIILFRFSIKIFSRHIQSKYVLFFTLSVF